jgi:hypothetical protein
MPQIILAKSAGKDLASSDGELEYYRIIEQKVMEDEAEKKEAQRKRSIAMGLPESAVEGKSLGKE